MQKVTAGADIAARADAYGDAVARVVDGNDLWAVGDDGARGGRPRPRRRRPDARRGADLPPLRPLQVRPGDLPAQGGGRALDGARPAHHRARPAARARPSARTDRRRRARGPRRARPRRRGRARRAVPGPRRRTARRSSRHEHARVPRRHPRRASPRRCDRDRRVIFLGEDVGARRRRLQGHARAARAVRRRARVRHADLRARRSPAPRSARAVTGLRPIIEIMFGDFMALPMDALVNQAAKYWYITNEQASIPLVVRSAVGGGGRFGAVHSQTHGTWFQGIPGLKIVMPSNSAEAKGLLKGAIRDPNPVIFLEHKRLYSVKDEVADEPIEAIELGKARDRPRGRRPDHRLDRQGRARRAGRGRAARRRRRRRRGGRPAHPATARPRHRARVDRARPTGCWPSRRARAPAAGRPACSARSPRRRSHDLDDAWIIATDETPIPYSPTLEDAFMPNTDSIVAEVRGRLGAAV